MRACKILCLVFVSFLFPVYAQMEMPSVSMPSISSEGPSMPRITAPVLGTRFYTPGNVITNISNRQSTEVKSDSSADASKKDAETLGNQLKIITSKNDLTSSRLTANDVASLGSDGLFTGIYGLLGNDSQISNLYSSNTSNDVLLQTIMAQLDELKAETKKNTEVLSKTNLPITKSSEPEKQFKPSILRFYVNGYNIQDTIRTAYFSKKENDGSFLLTGDRKFTTDGKNREETFYLLFKADGNCGTSAGYYVEPQVVQDYKNERSFLYQLTSKPKIKADKTGNLVSVKYVSPDWNMDLLLDIGE